MIKVTLQVTWLLYRLQVVSVFLLPPFAVICVTVMFIALALTPSAFQYLHYNTDA